MSDETLTCARCGQPIAPGEAKMGLPLITAGELARIALRTPALLLGPPLDPVAYCATCRPLIARQRTNEQLKVLLSLLALLGMIGVLLYVVI